MGELADAMRSMGFEASQEDIDKMMEEMDGDGEGDIDFEEFLKLMEKKILSHDPKEEMTRAFGYFCEDGKSSITLKDLRRVADELGDTITDDELKGLIKSATKKEDATKITLEEFLKVMENQKLM